MTLIDFDFADFALFVKVELSVRLRLSPEMGAMLKYSPFFAETYQNICNGAKNVRKHVRL